MLIFLTLSGPHWNSAYPFDILSILSPGPDDSEQIEHAYHHLCDVDSGVLVEVGVGEDEVPVDGVGGYSPSASECRQVVAVTDGFVVVGFISNLIKRLCHKTMRCVVTEDMYDWVTLM